MNQSASSNMCVHCGGLIMEPNVVYGWAGPVCYCGWKTVQQYERQYTPVIQQGWQCPLCSQIISPMIQICPNHSPSVTITTNASQNIK